MRERQQREALARAQAQRQQRLARIQELEAQIASLEAQITAGNAANASYREAVTIAEELLEILAAEQAKYENLDSNGNPDLIAELESRKNQLVRDARASTP